ncbi:hypothetical protein CFE70_005272 [Pyrenophora teres f. teres 0-1]
MAHHGRSSRDYPAGRSSHHRSSRDREYVSEKTPRTVPPHSDDRRSRSRRRSSLPQYNHNGHAVTPGIHPEGESGRRGFHPIKFLAICGRSSSMPSMLVNLLWPIVPVAIAMFGQHFAKREWHLPIFICNYIAMLPAANMLGFAGQEFSRKMPNKAFAVVLETTFGSIVEIILFMTLLKTSNGDSNVQVIRAAILGSILANLLLCLGICFIAGGLKNKTQDFHSAISENGSGLMLVASMALVLPAIFYSYLNGNADFQQTINVATNTRLISRGVAIISIVGFFIYLAFQTMSHDGLLHEIYEADDHKDKDRHEELKKPKLTLTEVIIALIISVTCVALVAIALVQEIPHLVEERAYDNQINMALAHVLGASIQTALFNAPLVVLVGWGIGVHMDYNFTMFDAAALVLAVLAVGSFLRDGSSNYLEGVLCVMIYMIIAICAFYFPNPLHEGASTAGHSAGAAEGGGGH